MKKNIFRKKIITIGSGVDGRGGCCLIISGGGSGKLLDSLIIISPFK